MLVDCYVTSSLNFLYFLTLEKVSEEIKNREEIFIQILDESSTRGFIM